MLAGGLNIKNLKKGVELTGVTYCRHIIWSREKRIKCPKKIKELVSYVKKTNLNKFKNLIFINSLIKMVDWWISVGDLLQKH